MNLHYILVVAVLIRFAEGKVDSNNRDINKHHNHGNGGIPQDHKGDESLNHLKIFIEEFKLRRTEHNAVVQSMAALEDRKHRPMIEEIRKNIKQILEENRETLDRISWKPQEPFPYDSDLLKTSLSKVLENIAFFSDLVNTFPSLFEKAIKKDRKLNTVVVWAYNYAKETGYLDEETIVAVDNMAKKLLIAPEDKPDQKANDKKNAKKAKEKKINEKSKDQKPSKHKKDESKRVKGEL